MNDRKNQDKLLQLVSLEHAVPLFELTEKDRERLRRWLPWVDTTTTLQHMEGFVSRVTEEKEKRESVHFVVLDRGEISGVAGAHRIDEENNVAEIGYWLRLQSEGKGLISRSCEKLIEYLIESYDVEIIEIRTSPENERSQSVATRLGFTRQNTSDSSESLFTLSKTKYLANQTSLITPEAAPPSS